MARPSHVSRETRHFYSREYSWSNNVMKKIPRSINVINPALTRLTPTHHECCNPYDRQSSRMSFTATATSYIWVTQNLKRRMETASHMKDIPVAPSLRDSLIIHSGYYVIHPGYQNTTTATSNPSNDVRPMVSTIRMT